jgi:tRNA uridine 5-carboxymethylaminomethyl modification enzyme
MGLVDDVRWDAFCRKRDAVSRETERLKSIWVSPKKVTPEEAVRVFGKALEHEYSFAELLRRPDVSYEALMTLEDGKFRVPVLGQGVDLAVEGVSRETPTQDHVDMAASVIEQIEIAAKYSGYIDRQKDEVERAAHYENLRLPTDLDYMQVTALSIEARQKLNKQRPETLGQAARISGITPAAVSLLLIHLKKGGRKLHALAGVGGAGADDAQASDKVSA